MLLKLDQVQKNYGDFVLNVSMELLEGRVTGLIGANGAGKSTTIKAILGLIKTDAGRMEIFDNGGKKITVRDKEEMGVVLAENTFSMMLTVKNVAGILKAMYPRFDKEYFLGKCEKYGLPLDKKLKDFSTGMKAKLKLLSAMSHQARLLILDEPTVGLDAVTRSQLLEEMREYMEKEDRGILISSHISSDLEGLCDDLYFLQDGKIILHEDTDVLLSEYGILKVSKEQYEKLDKQYVMAEKKETYGYMLLTKERQFYADNYKGIVIEKGSIDDVLILLTQKTGGLL